MLSIRTQRAIVASEKSDAAGLQEPNGRVHIEAQVVKDYDLDSTAWVVLPSKY